MARPTLAICGAGMVAGVHASAAGALGWRTVAVASRTDASARRLARAADARVVPVEALPAGADITVVSTPPASHADLAIRLLDAGAAVIIEQPLCTTLGDADRLVEASDRSGHRALYAANLAWSPVVQEFVRATRSIGALQHLELRALHTPATWRTTTEEQWGGGVLFDLGVQPLAMALLVAGNLDVRRVSCEPTAATGQTPLGPDERADVRLEFDGDLTARVVVARRLGAEPVWDAQASSATGVVRAEIFPTPSLEVNGETVPLAASTMSRTAGALEHAGYIGQLAAFAEDLAQRRAPLTDLRFGRRVLEIVMAAATSAAAGGSWVTLPFEGPRDHAPMDLRHR